MVQEDLRRESVPGVEAVPVQIHGRAGYDIRVNDPEATVQDYIDAVERFMEQNEFYRSRRPELDTCFACDLCCQERIPVTLVDAWNLAGSGANKRLNMEEAGGTLKNVIEKLLHVFVDRKMVDITMGLDESGRCRLLDLTGICTDYGRRPLVCRTFVCCPSARNAKQLREEIVNSGEDELVRAWFGIKGADGLLIMHEADFPRPDPRDFPETPFFKAADYTQVKLKDICSPRLWGRITAQGR